jgi:hypothetical protein
MTATDRDKFVRLANKRVSNAIKAIQLIGNLSNRSNYNYTDADVQKIFRALHEEMSASKKKFDMAQKRNGKSTGFSLE